MMAHKLMMALGLAWICQLIRADTVPMFPESPPEGVDCSLDDDITNPQLTECLHWGRKFATRYLRHLRRGENIPVRKAFDKCSAFIRLHDCLQPLLENCPEIRQVVHKEWAPVLQTMRCACSGNQGCSQDLQCFEEEYRGVFTEACDKHFELDYRQETRSKCHFQRRAVLCKSTLMRSGCGPEIGNFSFYLFRIAEYHELDKEGCYVGTNHPYSGLEYSDFCPRNMTNTISQCRADFLVPHTMLKFRSNENDLIANGGKRTIEAACIHYRMYRSCLQPITDSCPEAMTEIETFDNDLRKYQLKMDFICKAENHGYVRNLRCYQDSWTKGLLRECDKIWPKLNRTSPYRFYCDTQHKDSKRMHQELDEIRRCYQLKFESACGAKPGSTMGELITRAFQDPVYLRLKYKPRCEGHAYPTTTTTTTSTTTTIATTTKPRSTTLRKYIRKERTHVPLDDHSGSALASLSVTTFSFSYFLTTLVVLVR